MTTFTYNGHSYLLSNAGTWQDAQAEAVSMGGNLVTINDQAEQDWLTSTFIGNEPLWIGYTDQEIEGVWKWISGESSSYTNWGNGEPNDANGEDYGLLSFWNNTGYWNDVPNNANNTSLTNNYPLQGIIEIQNNPKLTLSANTNPIEGSTNGICTITLDRPAPVGGLNINFNTAGSTATFGKDYNLLAGTNVSNVTTNSFKIAAGVTTATLKLAALADIVADPNETVSINLTTGVGYSLAIKAITFAKTDYSSGAGTISVNVGDFNGDSKSDLLVVNKISDSNNTVSVMLRNAANTDFDSKIEIATDSNPEYVNIGDFNNDGRNDIAIAYTGSNVVSILLRNVNNTGFELNEEYLTNWNPNAISSGDFNNDGKTDLVVANSTYSKVSVFFRNTTNTGFDEKIDYVTGWAPNSVSTGDFNNDGKTDLVAANLGDGTVSVLLRNSTNTGFDAKLDYVTVPQGSQPISVDVGDFNNDGRSDIVVTNWAGSVSVLLRNSNNTGFDDAVIYPITAYGGKVSVGDFNNDGKDDFAVSNSYSNAISVFTRNANNTDFDKKVDYYATGQNSGSVSVGDFNNDGQDDLVTSNDTSNTVSIFFSTSTASAALTIADVAPLLNHLPTGTVTINDTSPQPNQVLTAYNTLADADGMGAVSYLWFDDSSPISTLFNQGPTYKVTANDLGKVFSVVANYTDSLGNNESVRSYSTNPVTAPVSAGFTITPQSQLTSEQGDSASYKISLNTAPFVNQNVTLTFTSSDTTEGVIDNSTLIFTSSNYATPQTLTVRGVDDYLDDGNIPYLVTAKVSTIDVFYKSLPISPFSMTNFDDGADVSLDLYGDEGGSKIDVLSGGNGADTIHGLNMADNLSGGLGNDTIYGGYGADNLFGEEGNDKLLGEQEADYLDGGVGNDTLDGGDGVDTMIGGAGNDTYYLGYDATDVIDDQGLSTDVDTVIMPYQLTKYTLPAGIEKGTIAAGLQASSLTGNGSNNMLTGNDGSNTLSGAVGRDSLFGGSGNDVLNGGTGNDVMTGGNGKDSFVLNTALTLNTDKIADFKPVDDTIKLENLIFTKLTVTGVLGVTNFFVGAAAHDPNDYVIYNPTTGAVTYDSDGSGAGQGVIIATLGVNLTVTNADFVVF